MLSKLEQARQRARAAQIWQPIPNSPQEAAYYCEADELFYGGAAGGGKTDLLLGVACTRHRNSIIFRREYKQMVGSEGMVDRSQEILAGTGAEYHDQKMVWKNIPGRRQIEFGAVQLEKDKNKYKGRPHDFLGFDEVPEFSESQYTFLTAWNRTTIKGQRCRIITTGNPPTTAEGEWIIRRWAAWLDDQHPNPALPGELRWYARPSDEEVEREDGTPFTHKGHTIYPKSRTFIPARLSDNPYLASTGYGATLQALPQPLRSQLLFGDFSIGLDENVFQCIPTDWVLAAQARWTPHRPEAKDDAGAAPRVPLTSLGVDVARGGSNQTVIAQLYGVWFAPLRAWPGRETPDGDVAATLVIAAHDGMAPIGVDVIGVGGSVYDTLKHQVPACWGINFAAGSQARDASGQFGLLNLRSQAYWQFREALDPIKGAGIALPPDRELRADLCAPLWKLSRQGIQVESKPDVMKRLGRSPDKGDAVVLAWLARNYAGSFWEPLKMSYQD